MIHDAIYFAMCWKFITRLSSVLTMLGQRDDGISQRRHRA